MSQYDHNQSAGANPPPPMSTCTSPPPPIGYPTNQPSHGSVAQGKVETKSKGDGFFKGCLAAMCCCCALDICF
ncbi:putative cysteine-rich transmembrane CYSTM domain-containing protein [Arabidopsis thaliana]|uniref:Protein CYSTEINE-RICH TRANSMEMBRANE MODULE 1 n=4 Tax=Arabidopsis TaxID=3701 RepID=CSTM1_ARATH|nr:cysteine-rich TM module stress tolerance protein [Arabidopsis thaliana]O23035.1 RecName: Full=Protein CYSTEINE-RICH TRANSMEMBRANE MODULE 1; Short=AthCYSTM1 [Arabidopsis thaliana]KAG7595922.1 Cysteine-rich transmembrane CYSTM domain [Arabidopsis suecica]KAG7645168.1 Cysteine-rich transmembrane CYSTM domain [Arabidopsis thaliana x Arabidopsis arenosa]AAB71443.1 EST gb/ATTS0295 comes from this gene [Arabidopsis thaliana]AAK25854.1 unknown protein [Arabidopsis thaliana]AAL07255.1 unknown prote|eukprot:NP_563734.1 cysteine-rich TM module stress tolerance protein [Arabidopsis thaliana]